jgi:3',5'-cyclic AMP phosphodiesterase CpdA
MRIVSVNSNERLEEQTEWLDRVLESNPNPWTVVAFHHPVFSTKEGRDNKTLRDLWKPLFDRHGVDLVLTGHDHTYGRGRNLPMGVSEVDSGAGTVYVVSVSGPKMYVLDPEPWWDRAAENTQLYQVISVDGGTLRYEARTAVGDLYDAFELVKRDRRPNRMIDRTPPAVPERRHANTITGGR